MAMFYGVNQAVPRVANQARTMSAVTKADANLANGLTLGLLVGVPGTANIMDASGTIHSNVPLQQGYNPLSVQQVRTGGTATDIWALY